MRVFQMISFLIQMHFLMHFYNSCEERDENTMLRYVHTNLIARDCQKLISFYKKVFHCRSIGETLYKMGESEDLQPQYPVEISADGKIDGRFVFWNRSLNHKNGSTIIKDAK